MDWGKIGAWDIHLAFFSEDLGDVYRRFLATNSDQVYFGANGGRRRSRGRRGGRRRGR